MKEVLVIKNITREGPGLLEDVLQEDSYTYKIVDLTQEPFPDVEPYGAVVVLGGPDSANDQNSKMRTELMQIRKALELRIPYLGICLGLQTLVRAAGGSVVPSPVREVGFRDPEGEIFSVSLTPEGAQDKLFSAFEASFPVFQLHGEMVELAPDMTLLATGKFCKNQVVKFGENAYGIQSHVELTPDLFKTWLDEDPDLRKLDRASLEADFETLSPKYREIGKRFFRNFLAL